MNSGQSIVSGNKVQFLPPLGMKHDHELTWLVQGKGSVNLVLGAPHVGTQTIKVNLK